MTTAKIDLGYGDASPDLGYVTANPDLGYGNIFGSNADLGYGDTNADVTANPDLGYGNIFGNSNDLGYGDTNADLGYRETPRRSSLKSANKKNGTRRRASMGYSGEMTIVLPSGERRIKRTSITFKDQEETKEVKPVSNTRLRQEKYPDIEQSDGCIEAKIGVLEEYAVQKARGTYNSDNIRQMYTYHTIDSQLEAVERAYAEEREVQNYLKDTRKTHRRRRRRQSC